MSNPTNVNVTMNSALSFLLFWSLIFFGCCSVDIGGTEYGFNCTGCGPLSFTKAKPVQKP